MHMFRGIFDGSITSRGVLNIIDGHCLYIEREREGERGEKEREKERKEKEKKGKGR